MTKKICLLACSLLFAACSHYGGGTTGTGLNFRDGMREGISVSGSAESAIAPSVGSVPTKVNGKIVDEKGQPVKGLEVLVECVSDSQTAVLDGRGEFHLLLGLAPSGLLTVSIPSKGESSYADYPLSGSESGAMNLRLQLKKDGTLKILECNTPVK